MTGGQLEQYINEGENGDKVLRAFISCFNHDEKGKEKTTTVFLPRALNKEDKVSKVDEEKLIEEVKAAIKSTTPKRKREFVSSAVF
jgi:protoporphyrinogen oxidase